MSPDKKEIMKWERWRRNTTVFWSVWPRTSVFSVLFQIKRTSGRRQIGRLKTIQHKEEEGYWHQAHSFVRGNWRNAEESSPNDPAEMLSFMDIMLWLADSKCESLVPLVNCLILQRKMHRKELLLLLDGCPIEMNVLLCTTLLSGEFRWLSGTCSDRSDRSGACIGGFEKRTLRKMCIPL